MLQIKLSTILHRLLYSGNTELWKTRLLVGDLYCYFKGTHMLYILTSIWLLRTTNTGQKREKRVLYISTSVWVLRTPNAGQNSHFQRFLC